MQLLTTKLTIPPLRENLIERKRLILALDKSILTHPLTIISASAGFGKTTLVQQWLQIRMDEVCWLSLDTGDNDPIRFWFHFISSLQNIFPDVGNNLLAVLISINNIQTGDMQDLLVDVINQINQHNHHKEKKVIILDDYQFIENKDIHETLAFLVTNLPVNLRLLITSRIDPPWKLSKMRVRGLLGEIRTKDLRFNQKEILSLIHKTDESVSEEDIQQLSQITEGWIVGLQMALMSQPEAPHQSISRFDRSLKNQYIIDFFLEEILDHLPEEILDFVKKTSIFEQFNAPFCDAVLGIRNSSQILFRLEHDNLFLIPLDNHRTWFRYHHLFRDLMQTRISSIPSEELNKINRNSAKWHLEHYYLEKALTHAFATKDDNYAGMICQKVSPILLRQSQSPTLFSWLDRLPKKTIQENPWLCIYYALALHWVGKREEGTKYLDIAEIHLRSDQNTFTDEESNSLIAYIALGRAHYHLIHGELPQTVEEAKKALDHLSPLDHYGLSSTGVALGGGYWGMGDSHQAEQAFLVSASMAQKGALYRCASSALCYAGTQQYQQARLKDAKKSFEKALKFSTDSNGEFYPNAGFALVKLSSLSVEELALSEATIKMKRAFTLCRILNQVDVLAEAHIINSQINTALGQFPQAASSLQQAIQLFQQYSLDPWIKTWIDEVELDIMLNTRKPHSLIPWLKNKIEFHTPDPNQTDSASSTTLLGAKYHYHHWRTTKDASSLSKAIEWGQSLNRKTKEGGETFHYLETLIFLSICHSAKNPIQAQTYLKEAILIAMEEEIRYSFVRYRHLITPILKDLLGDPEIKDYARSLVNLIEKTSEPASPQIKLTNRELEVLQLLNSEASLSQIGEQLCVSENTVKTHVKNIYQKLDVNRRIRAISKAKELNILQ